MENFNLDDINDVMDFVKFIFERGNKFKGEYPFVGYWEWKDFSVMLLNTGDVVLSDNKNEKTISVFSADRTLNNPIMQERGFVHRAYMLNEFLTPDNLEKLDKFEVS